MSRAILAEFVSEAPPGELPEVLDDIEVVAGQGSVSELGSAILNYHVSQFTQVSLGGKDTALITSVNNLGGNKFYDTKSGKSFIFDIKDNRAKDVEEYQPEGLTSFINQLIKQVDEYTLEHYVSQAASGVYPQPDGKVAIILVSNKFSPGNYWSGRWRSKYLIDDNTNSISGEVHVDTHYYEDGNVRVTSSKSVKIDNVIVKDAEKIIDKIGEFENDYQTRLHVSFADLNENEFKGLRRQLPVTRSKIDWDRDLGGYRLGQDIGGGRSSNNS